jgi:hypothetical protein
MRALIAILTLLGLGFSAAGVDSAPKPTPSFNLAATNCWFGRNIGKGLRLRVECDELGWEVYVYKKGSTDNLLLPRGNWHGPQLCQIYTWMPRKDGFGNDRLIPIHGSKQPVRIRIFGATASGRPGSERFTGGRADIYLGP